MSPLPGVPPTIALLMGPIVLGQCFAWGLYGILVVQMYFYSSTFPQDRPLIKSLAWSVFTIDTVMTILATHFAYANLATGWGDLEALVKVPWSMPPQPVFCGIVTSMVQCFYAWRIWILSRNKYVPAILALVSITQCGAAAYCGINLGIIGDWTKLDENNDPSIVWLGGSAFCDAAITISMVFLLVKANRSSSFRRTNSIINKLIQYTIETGLIPALGAIGELVFFLGMPTNNIHLIFFFTLAKLYSNSMMANLNARKIMTEPNTVATTGSANVGSFWVDQPGGGGIQRSGVRITTTTDQRVDMPGIKSRTDDLEMNLVGSKIDDKIIYHESTKSSFNNSM